MRERQAAKFILEAVLRRARQSNAKHIKNLHLRLGEISELDQNAIQRSWEELAEGTPAESAQLHFHPIPAEVQCMACFRKYHPENGKIHCPYCGSVGAKILSGEEFQIESIELDHA
ncbi:MAG TPA: hydrogenase maturation nickel metallochaperone HypA [Anaerolineales bacterium]|nr:hydrogenase maturation nickel metallochaperone HypA [Anaerolineales bacterium]